MSLRRFSCPALLALLCAAPATAAGGGRKDPAPPPPADPFQLVESWPVETTLDHADIPDAWVVWPEMIRSARATLDIAEFYVTSEKGHRMEPVLQAVEAAGKRGVKVRILVDGKFYKTYPADVDRLKTLKGVEVRIWDVEAQMGGVLHAKYFLVDSRQAYVGSQNFDWRSLEHVQELGVRVSDEGLTRVLQGVFDTDWSLAGGGDKAARAPVPEGGYGLPRTLTLPGGPIAVTPVASPTGWLPDETTWDLPRLVQLIDSAKKTVRVQLLNYKTTDPDGRYFADLEDALRRAAARKVQVEVLVSDWSKKKWTIEGLQSLESLPGITVKLVTIPPWSGGFVDYARTVHAKYLVVDGERAWLGTSNWGYDYFYESRNVGFVVEGAPIAGQLDRFFTDLWQSPYAEQVKPGAEYQAPRISNP